MVGFWHGWAEGGAFYVLDDPWRTMSRYKRTRGREIITETIAKKTQVKPFAPVILFFRNRFSSSYQMPGVPISNLGPFTPGHCSVCRALIPKVKDAGPGVEKWARNLNYMNHLKKYHPLYYKWSKRYTNSLYLPFVPFLILALVSTTMKSGPLLLVSIVALGVPYVPLLLYRWKKVREFREMWSQVGEA